MTRPWEKYTIQLYDFEQARHGRDQGHRDIAGGGRHYHLAVNIPNRGYIANLPDGAIVEVPAITSTGGIQGIGVGALPGPIAKLCRRETTVSQLCVDAAVRGDRQTALQCLLLDPIVHDLDLAQQILDDYLETYREYLPQFWRS